MKETCTYTKLPYLKYYWGTCALAGIPLKLLSFVCQHIFCAFYYRMIETCTYTNYHIAILFTTCALASISLEFLMSMCLGTKMKLLFMIKINKFLKKDPENMIITLKVFYYKEFPHATVEDVLSSTSSRHTHLILYFSTMFCTRYSWPLSFQMFYRYSKGFQVEQEKILEPGC